MRIDFLYYLQFKHTNISFVIHLSNMSVKYTASLNNKFNILSRQHGNKSLNTLPVLRQNTFFNLWSISVSRNVLHYLKFNDNFALLTTPSFPNIIVPQYRNLQIQFFKPFSKELYYLFAKTFAKRTFTLVGCYSVFRGFAIVLDSKTMRFLEKCTAMHWIV